MEVWGVDSFNRCSEDGALQNSGYSCVLIEDKSGRILNFPAVLSSNYFLNENELCKIHSKKSIENGT